MPLPTQGSLLAGRYQVLTRLGSGGMATVLLCRDERLGREVAVKRLHADSPEDAERRFLREAKLGASMNHPGLVSVYDTETDDEGLLIVMEYVEGESLADALRDGPLPPRRVAAIARELGDALDHVQANGVVHRDVKPANVLLGRDGTVKLADLGIAVSVDQTRVTRSGTVLGSAAYMAPEQLAGEEAGPAADVYAMSAVLFEALAGRKAREGRTPLELAHAIATTPPPDVRTYAPEVPAPAAHALALGMANEAAYRQRSAGLLAAELASGLEEQPAPEPTIPTRVLTPARRSRSVAGPIAVLLIALAAAAVIAAVLLAGGEEESPQKAKRQPAQQRQAPRREKAQAPAQVETTTTTTTTAGPAPSGAALNEQGFALMQRGDFAGALPVLRRAVASWPEDSTDLEYAYALFNLGATLNRTGHPDEAIPYLEKRLNWSNQRGVVKKELKLARQQAGG